jgi:hypothetical protein
MSTTFGGGNWDSGFNKKETILRQAEILDENRIVLYKRGK